MSTTLCRSCSQPLAAGQHFCASCGARVLESQSVAATGATDQLGQGPPPAYHAPPIASPAAYPTAQSYQPTQGWSAPTPPPPRAGATPGQLKALAAVIAAAVILAVLAVFMWPADQGDLVADASIGPAGGTIPMADGGKIEVPKDAVKETKRIVVHKTVVRSQTSIGGVAYPPGTLPLWTFGPDITFLRPVTIVLRLSPNAVAARIFVIDNGRLRLVALVTNPGGFASVVVTGFQNGRLVVRA